MTGKQVERAWEADDARLAALFGDAGDPSRGLREKAWAGFTGARNDLARAQERLDYLRSFPGGPSRGPGQAMVDALAALDAARGRFSGALRTLREHGINPVVMDRAIGDVVGDSLRERPRLLGGAPPVIHVDGIDDNRLVEIVPLSDGAGAHGMSVHITYTADDVQVRVDTPDEPAGSSAYRATVLEDGDLRLHDLRTGIDRFFDSRGMLRLESIPLRGTGGRPLGDSILVHHGPDGVTGHGMAGGGPHTVTPTGHGFRVDDPAAGPGPAYRLFDDDGLHTWDGHRIGDGGTGAGHLELPAPGRGGRGRWIGADGTAVDGFTVRRMTDAHGNPIGRAQVRSTADGSFTRFDLVTGEPFSTGTPLHGADRVPDGTIAVRPVGGGEGHIEDAAGRPRPGRVLDHPGGGLVVRLDDPAAGPSTYRRFDGGNVHVAGGRQVLDQHGGPAGFIETPLDGGPARFLDPGLGDRSAHTVRIDPGAGGAPGTIRVTDGATGNYRTFDEATGLLGDDAVMLHGVDGPLGRFGVARHRDGAVEHLGVGADGARLDSVTFHGDAGWRLSSGAGGVRAGEYRAFGRDGRLTGQRINVIEQGRVRPDRYFQVDFAADGNTWRLVRADGTPVRGLMHSGTVGIATDAGRVRLVARPGRMDVEVFDRRPLPDGAGSIDSIRRTDAGGFGKWTGGQRTRWTRYRPDGTASNWGVRTFDTLDGKAWHGHDRFGRHTHEFRQGVGSTVFGYKNGDGWSWVRYDRSDTTIVATGTRTYDRDGGWQDRLGADGPIVQRQWGRVHLPQNNAQHYREVVMDGDGVPRSVTVHHPDGRPDVRFLWNEQSEHGKPAGALERLPGGTGDGDLGKILEVHRWSEQRPPNWARKLIMGIDDRVWNAHPHLKVDTRFQMSTWEQTDIATGRVVTGYRFTGMNGSWIDVAADGTVLRAGARLANGRTLKVGNTVALPPGAAFDGRHLPWTEGAGGPSGHRVRIDGAADGRIWEDRFDPAATGGDWYRPGAPREDLRIARIGFADGTVREFRIGRDGVADPDVWVQRDMHGAVVARSDVWPGADGGAAHRIETRAPAGGDRWDFTGYNGRTDAQRWYWTDENAGGNATGPARNMAGYNGATPFDDSFAHFARVDGGIEAVRVRNVLGDGADVRAWKVTAADGTSGWQWAKFDRAGNTVDYPGTRIRQWWDPRAGGGAGGWTGDWPGAAGKTSRSMPRFRDLVIPPGRPGTEAVVVREVPATGIGNRIREYLESGNVRPADGTWKEYDLGTTVRQRQQAPDGGFLESDSLLGQWRRYDAGGDVIAQRVTSGFVYELDGARNAFSLTGRELDFRGPLTEYRGWSRRLREANRGEWRFARPGAPRPGAPRAEALYKPDWELIATKAAFEAVQEFVLEFAVNLAVNAIIADIQNRAFTGKDVAKAVANAGVGAGLKTGAGTLLHDNKMNVLRHTADWRMGLANLDSGKFWNRHPFQHDKHWSNEWAGNETPTRWRGGTYDFAYNAAIGTLANWVNGSMNAAVFGFQNAAGETVTVGGGAAVLDGLVAAAGGLTSAMTAGLAKNLFINGLGGRAFHRQGAGELVAQFAWRLPEKLLSWELTQVFRAGLGPAWYQVPAIDPAAGGPPSEALG